MNTTRQNETHLTSSRDAPGRLVVVSGPSGVGKGTLVNALLPRAAAEVTRLITCTTRPPRPGEQHGLDYFFLSPETFTQMVERQEFLEHARYGSHLYGTPRQPVEEKTAGGWDVILVIEVQGAAQVKKVWPGAVFIFIRPPDMDELAQRLAGRQTESAAAVQERLTIARREMEYLWHYDYQVINDRVDEAVEKLQAILIAERCRIRSQSRVGDKHPS